MKSDTTLRPIAKKTTKTLLNLQNFLRRPRTKFIAWAFLPITATVSFLAFGTGTAPAIPAINISADPLYAAAAVDKPTLALALSVEYPTVGSQYPSGGTTDNTYSNLQEYLGYYDAESCYVYNNAPSETPAAGLTTADYKRFDRSGAATSRKCTDAFSGNFLNWASSSAIDMLRLALSGGDRYIDTATPNSSLTILQRAVIPNNDPVCMWNTSNFPAKQLQRDGSAAGTYWGAVPAAMITAANGNDIWVANTLNRIYFGTSNTGDCSTGPASYKLGSPTATSSVGPVTTTSNALPLSGMTSCSNEGNTCSFSGTKEVWYGVRVGLTNYWKVAPASNGVACSNDVFGDPKSGTPKQCYYRNYTGNWTPPVATGLNSDGFFYARVQVCNTTSGTLQDVRSAYNLCRQYPNGNYKPTGVIQKYSDQMRLAAFGYLMDQTASYNNGRYGGVLRAPMKYVGSKTFNTTGQDNTPSGGNPNAEWNANTGVFLSNPDNDNTQTPNISGVINYLNKFGRTGPTPGRYKIYDPVGELHYETLRYLQGLQPTSAATNNITSEMYDGYPVYQNWTDPYANRSNASDYSCLKSNIVVIGDINTHDGNRFPTPSGANNIPDINAWRGIVQAFEKNQSVSYLDGQNVSRTTGNPNGANNSVPTNSQTSQIMGSAYWSHTHDIRGADWTAAPDKQRPGLRVKTFLFDVNEYGAQNNASTRRFANQFFMASKYGGFESDPTNSGAKPYNTYGNPFKRQDGTNDNNVWQKSADPGEAGTYYLQSSARGVLSAFDEIFSRASTQARSIAGSSAASTTINSSSGSVVYSAKFDTSNWSGDVIAEPLSASGSSLVLGTPLWSAADRLSVMASPAVNRKIYVGNTAGNANPVASDFTWSTIEGSLQAYLDKTDPAASADGQGSARVSFLRGDRSKEGSPFRVRSSLLGDVVNSSVVYSGAPTAAYSGAGYTAFRNAYKTRTPAVFVGANDGMLHSFNATNGNELFAYIPSWLGHKLSALTNPTYSTSHQSYVDASPVVAEAQVASNGTASDWKTVLVSGTGGGGSGVFALDVSDPSNFTVANVMWEFKRSDDADMGQVIGKPQILKLKTSGSSSTSTYRWFAVVASGANNYVPDINGAFSASGQPALFLLALDKQPGTTWSLGNNYFKISLPVDSSLSTTKATGLVNFQPLWGSAGEVTQIYMGDFHGNLWKLDFSKNLATSDWNMNKLTAFNKGTAGSPTPYPLYIAKDASNNVQPITSAPAIFSGPTVSGLETFYVTFGTGKYLETGDNTSTATNSFYAVYDNGNTAADSSPAGASVINGRARLKQGSVNTNTRVVTVGAFKWGRAASDTDATQRSGWYFDMPTAGEKLVSAIGDQGSLYATFNTIIPGATGATGTCTNTPGNSNAYVIDIGEGSGRYNRSTVGLLGPSMFFTNESETTPAPLDSTGRGWRTTTLRSATIGQGGASTSTQVVSITEAVGRLSWRQINNYQDMKNKVVP
ncbi:pilus assembly protein [Paracidovorax valerianellae]|uniref:Type IV pilus assembly protein PilY1 n=1 Tax=Paracidovorax valerianellae TaxID=187868 RepID=A0A1G6X5G3_9BURK|nr:PilC/PilY family type IV pilus protein [Paracidovorax valerianellae]MDA8447734.1 PilC/PilY family type IV pilus protein [Paracidovorax valerianellae]SDD73392.1 type IV pilus assembly protein PilY1 [Paracidovorax valerianellae]